MAKIMKNNIDITRTLNTFVTAFRSASIATWKASILVINLRGLNTLNKRRTLKNYRFTLSRNVLTMLRPVTKKSKVFEVFLK